MAIEDQPTAAPAPEGVDNATLTAELARLNDDGELQEVSEEPAAEPVVEPEAATEDPDDETEETIRAVKKNV